MSLNCRLNRNISLNQPSDSGGTDSCNSQDISMGVGGIQSPVLIYNIDDVKSLKFKDDNRADDSLEVDTINAVGTYYKVDFSSASYTEELNNGKWTHQLELNISNITNLFEDLLSDASNGHYLVCFRPKGSEDYRCFGWKYGASLDYGMNIQEDSLGYTVTFEDESEFPLFTVYRDNFGSKDKVYTPIFTPKYDTYFCEHQPTGNTGYLIAMYVVKTNAAGQPLDRNNKLCQWSGLKQDAYKYYDVADDGGYNIIGTYLSTAEFDGRPVKILDYDKCKAVVSDSLFINGKKTESITLSNVHTTENVIINATDNWSLASTWDLDMTIAPTVGSSGNTEVQVAFGGEFGGTNVITFQNTTSYETVTLTVNALSININETYTFPNGTTEFILTPEVYGGSADYTYSVSPSLSVTKDGNGYLVCHPSVSSSEQNFTFNLYHQDDPNVTAIVRVKILGADASANWQLLSSFCENI